MCFGLVGWLVVVLELMAVVNTRSVGDLRCIFGHLKSPCHDVSVDGILTLLGGLV